MSYDYQVEVQAAFDDCFPDPEFAELDAAAAYLASAPVDDWGFYLDEAAVEEAALVVASNRWSSLA